MSENNCGGFRFYEAGYTWDKRGENFRMRKLWSVGSTAGGKYVSVKKADMKKQPIPVTATGEADSELDAVNIKCVKVVKNETMAIQLWFYLTFSDGENDWSVSASECSGVTASKGNPDSCTPFQFISLHSPNDTFLVFKSDKKNEKDHPLYLSSDGAGNMKLKAWNRPVPDPPRTTNEVDPALLFRLVPPLGAKN